MRQFITQMFVQCDCCGKSKMYEEGKYYCNNKENAKDPQDDKYMWSNIHINARIDQDYYLDHTIVLCPECCGKVLNTIKEKCNYCNNWPSPYKIGDIAIGTDKR